MKHTDDQSDLDGFNSGKKNETNDRQYILDLFKDRADLKAESIYKSKIKRERETIELLGGGYTSIQIEQQKKAHLIASLPQKHGAKFTMFFKEIGRLAGWTDEQKKKFQKPGIAPRIINRYIYSRFPPEIMAHVLEKNPYIKWCKREHKHYFFLGDDGVLILEKFIDEVVTVMRRCNTVYEFQKEFSIKFHLGFQPVLFEKYLGLIGKTL